MNVAIAVVNVVLLIVLSYQIRRLNRILRKIDITVVKDVMEHNDEENLQKAFAYQTRLSQQCGYGNRDAWHEAKKRYGIKD